MRAATNMSMLAAYASINAPCMVDHPPHLERQAGQVNDDCAGDARLGHELGAGGEQHALQPLPCPSATHVSVVGIQNRKSGRLHGSAAQTPRLCMAMPALCLPSLPMLNHIELSAQHHQHRCGQLGTCMHVRRAVRNPQSAASHCTSPLNHPLLTCGTS